jgi:hypothetical protein
MPGLLKYKVHAEEVTEDVNVGDNQRGEVERFIWPYLTCRND